MTIEEIIDTLQEKHGATITKGVVYYNVHIWDNSVDAYQDLDLTESELIDLYETYFLNMRQ